jgi:hypothetical protein
MNVALIEKRGYINGPGCRQESAYTGELQGGVVDFFSILNYVINIRFSGRGEPGSKAPRDGSRLVTFSFFTQFPTGGIARKS